MIKAAFGALGMVFIATIAQAQDFSADELHRRMVERRAVATVIWGMSAVNTDLMLQETYRLTVPPNVPVEQYWSATAYDRETHALIRDMPRASRSSQ